MEEKEYREKLKKIEADFKTARETLYSEYGLSQAKCAIGDIVKDNRWALKVDKITVSKGFGLPEPVYHGFELKKDLTPKKNFSRVAIHGNNGVEVIKNKK